MAGKWTGGIVNSPIGDEPPTVDEWAPVAVPGRPPRFADVEEPMAYRTTFADPRNHPAERTRIRIHGAYGRAHVWVNGRRLGTHEPYFVPAHFEFEPRQQNELIVCCEPPALGGGLYETDEVPAERTVPGIWWDVRLQVRPTTFVRSLTVEPRLTDDGGVIETDVEIDAGESVDDAVTLSLRPEGFRGGGAMERMSVDADAGDRVTVSKSIEVRDPELWWPRGHGPQHRYTVRAKLGEDTVERTVGFRTIERDDDGLLVNGRRIRVRGVGRYPPRTDDEREDVRRTIDANATLVRLRGHVPSPAFYDACDEAGLLVWQDLPIRSDELEVDAAEKLLQAIEETYGSHPSLAMYGIEADADDPFTDPLGSGFRSRLLFRWRAWRASSDRTVAESLTADRHTDRPVVSVSGPPGSDVDAVDLSTGWRYLEASDAEWVFERYPTSIVGSFGAGSVVTAEIDSESTSVPGLETSILDRHASDVEGTQAYQAKTVKTVAETLRRHGCGIVVADALRDRAPVGGTGALTENGSPKPAYDALTSAYEPVQVVLDGESNGESADLVLINDTDGRVDTTVTWQTNETSGETSATAAPLEITPLGSIDIPTDTTEVTLAFSVGDRTVRNEYRL